MFFRGWWIFLIISIFLSSIMQFLFWSTDPQLLGNPRSMGIHWEASDEDVAGLDKMGAKDVTTRY